MSFPARPPACRTTAARLVMGWLRDGVPITLLCDLAAAAGPDSREVYGRELFDRGATDDPTSAKSAEGVGAAPPKCRVAAGG